jgi:diguanylate cyclase (GGDEF)-like protein/PAS domain S-box-containing protein
MLTLVLMGATAYYWMGVADETNRWIRHTHDVLVTINDLALAMKSVESSSRDFALTGKDEYVETYRQNVANVERNEASIRSLTADNRLQQSRLPALEALAAENIRNAGTTIALRRDRGLTAVVAMGNDAGQRSSDAFDAVTTDLRTEELRLRVLRTATDERYMMQVKLILIFATLLGISVVGAAAWSAQREISKRAQADEALKISEERLRLLFDGIQDYAIFMMDAEGRVVSWNAGAERIKGYTALEIVGRDYSLFFPQGDRDRGKPQEILRLAASHDRFEEIGMRVRKDGSEYLAGVSNAALHDSNGNLLGFSVISHDLTRSLESEARYRGLLEAAPDGMVVVNQVGEIVLLNAQAEKQFGYRRDELLGQKVKNIIPEGFAERLIADGTRTAAEALAQQIGTGIELNGRRNDGSVFPIEIMLSPLESFGGILVTAAIRDITVRKDAEKHLAQMMDQISHSSQHDSLTGLPNRLLLKDRIGQAIALARRHSSQVAVMFLDLDGFKHINDSLGHSAGDRLLQSIARRLADCVRTPDTVSRHGGDEFVILLQDVNQPEDAANAAARMLKAVAEPHSIGRQELHVTATIGVSVFPDDGKDAETLIKNADTAMYQAKENGRQSFKFFRPEMNVRAVERQSIEEDLRSALKRKEFTLHYQPKINLKSGEITGVEALLRWTHPTRGSVPPLKFIAVAEDSGLILPIGAWVMHEACTQARAWADAGLPAMTMAVNVSVVQFRNENFLDDLFATLRETGLDPQSLEIELTESVLMKHSELAALILKTLREKGVRVSVDDFGTGYSSLSYLQQFPLDSLKIDQSFVRRITTNPNETSIVSAIIRMAQSLNLRVVAEGVETAKDLAFLRAHDCDEAQGFYLSRPVPAEQIVKLLEAQGTGVGGAVSAVGG